MAQLDQDILPSRPRHLSVRQFTANDWPDIVQALEVAGQTEFVGISIHLSAKGNVDALAFAAAEKILYIALGKPCSSGDAQKRSAVSLTKPTSRPLAGFAMERIALRLYHDHHFLLHGIDLATLRPTRLSPADFIRTNVDHQVCVASIYKLWRATGGIDVMKSTCLKAWLSSVCASASLEDMKTTIPLSTINMTPTTLICLANITSLADRLQKHQPMCIQGEVQSVRHHARKNHIELVNLRFKTRIHQDRSRKIILKTILGNKLVGRTVKANGRATRIRIVQGAYQNEGLQEILVCGRQEGKLAEQARDIFIRDLLQGTTKIEDSSFIGRIWFSHPQTAPDLSWPPHQLMLGRSTFSELNASQRLVAAAMISSSHPLVITHGPPGTGKTYTIASVVKHWIAELGSDVVFIVAQSNVGVKNIARALRNKGVEDFTLIVSDDFYVDWHEHIYAGMHQNTMRSSEMDKQIRTNQFPKACRVVLCTLSMLSHPVLNHSLDTLRVHKLVMDEASQVHIADYMHILHRLKHLQKLCFFGDPNQLPPYGHDAIPELQSIFDVAHLKASAYFLNTQYRMPVPLGNFLSQEVYDSHLQSVHSTTSTSCVAFIDVAEGQEQKKGRSWINTQEVDAVVALVRDYYNRSGVCVITPYDAQRAEIQKALEQADLPNDMVFNVDSFQGHEAKYVIISAVRTRGPGFLSVHNRTNVMLSRCQAGMVIVSNRTFVEGAAKDTLLGKLAAYWDQKGADTWLSCEQVLTGTAQLPGVAQAIVCPTAVFSAEVEEVAARVESMTLD